MCVQIHRSKSADRISGPPAALVYPHTTTGLNALAARAPYFHNGSAATLRDVVEFYDRPGMIE
jgi:cytochrome c peroxidase